MALSIVNSVIKLFTGRQVWFLLNKSFHKALSMVKTV